MTNVLTIDDDLRDALEWAIGLALDDQQYYLSHGDPAADYGAEWNEAAAMKIGWLRGLAKVCRQTGCDGMAGSCRALAAQIKGTIETPKKKRGKKNGK